MRNSVEIKKIVKERYKKIAVENTGCGCGCKNSKEISKSIGYSDKDIALGEGANLGLGCGNPVAFSKIKQGDVVLDLGCGAGFDCFLASKKVMTTKLIIILSFQINFAQFLHRVNQNQIG